MSCQAELLTDLKWCHQCGNWCNNSKYDCITKSTGILSCTLHQKSSKKWATVPGRQTANTWPSSMLQQPSNNLWVMGEFLIDLAGHCVRISTLFHTLQHQKTSSWWLPHFHTFTLHWNHHHKLCSSGRTLAIQSLADIAMVLLMEWVRLGREMKLPLTPSEVSLLWVCLPQSYNTSSSSSPW